MIQTVRFAVKGVKRDQSSVNVFPHFYQAPVLRHKNTRKFSVSYLFHTAAPESVCTSCVRRDAIRSQRSWRMKGKDIQHAPTKRRRQVQMIFGGTPNNPTLISTCRECSMKYHKHVPAEVKLHKAFHDEATKGPMIRFTPAHRLEEWTQSGPSGRATVSAFVLSKDTKSEVTLGEKIMKIVNSELGATDDDDHWKNPTKKDSKAFAIVADKRVVAMVTTNAPSEGHWMVYRTQHLVPNQVIKTVRMGISRIWVCSSWRRRGLGSKLLDLVQRFATEKVLSPHEIAFSQPSEAGRHLSKNFNGVSHKSGEVLIPVYND